MIDTLYRLLWIMWGAYVGWRGHILYLSYREMKEAERRSKERWRLIKERIKERIEGEASR